MSFLKSLIVVYGGCFAAANPLDVSAIEHLHEKRTGGGLCSSANFVPSSISGSTKSGGSFCESDWARTYTPVTNITVWSQPNSVNGIQVTYADGSQSAVYGTKNTQYMSSIGLDYSQGQRWTGWTGYHASSSGGFGGCGFGGTCAPNPNLNALHISASNGQSLQAGESSYNLGQNHVPANVQDVGTGILFGIKGTNDSQNINSIGALFLSSGIKTIQITNFTFPSGPTGSQNIQIDNLDNAHFYNGQTSGNSTWTFSSSEALTTTNTFTQQTTSTYGTTETVSLTLSIPIVTSLSGSESTAFMWQKAYMQSSATTITKTITVSWSEMGTLTPKTGVDATALVGQGVGTFPYTCEVNITLANGSSFRYKENGFLTINDVSNAVVTVKTNNSPA